jgi:NADH-quinone oxidoreductase subunit C
VTPEEIQLRLAGLLGEKAPALAPGNKDPFLPVAVEHLLAVCTALRDDPELQMECLMNLGAVDWPVRGKEKVDQIEMVYHFYSYQKRHTFIIKTRLPRQEPVCPSLAGLWPAADWLEREQFDLLGVTFTGHPDLRRLMMPDDWVGHPLRKDYAEQASWHGITTVRESPLDGFVRLDDLKKRLAESKAESEAKAAAGSAPADAPTGAPKGEVLQ